MFISALPRLSAWCATILVASGLVVAPFLTGPAAAAELVQDGSFEAATGSAAEFAGAGITATVAAATSTTRIYAKAAKAGQNDSACSTTSVAYSHLGPPETMLVKTPKQTVPSRKRKHKVAFAFSSATAGATFECSIDGKAFRACTSGHKFKLKVGRHTFAVRALASGLIDPTPATYRFKIKRKR